MAISFTRLFNLLSSRGISIYKLKTDKVVGTATVDKIRRNNIGKGVNAKGQKRENIDTASIDAICKYLNCQPGDIMEYIKDK